MQAPSIQAILLSPRSKVRAIASDLNPCAAEVLTFPTNTVKILAGRDSTKNLMLSQENLIILESQNDHRLFPKQNRSLKLLRFTINRLNRPTKLRARRKLSLLSKLSKYS